MTSQLQLDRTQPAPGPPRPHGRRHRGVLLAVAAGGALGTVCRYGLAQLLPPEPGKFPWETLAVNVCGSLALGALLVVFLARFPPSRLLRPFVVTGFLGAFTTYSTFAVETVVLASDGHRAIAAAYVIVSLVGGLGAAGAGVASARTLIGRSEQADR